MKNGIKLFEQNRIRSIYDEEKDIWYFSVLERNSKCKKKSKKTQK